MKAKPQVIAGLDLGERHFTMAVGYYYPTGRLTLEAVESLPAQGMEGGMISDAIECADAVARLIRQVENALPERIHLVLAAIHGTHLKSYNATASIPISEPGVGISYRDVEKVLTVCRSLSLEYDRQILHAFERGFAVDNQAGIKNPVGLYGTKLTAHLHLVTAHSLQLQNVTRVLNRAGLEVECFVLPGLCAAEAVLSDLDQDLGVTLIRVGEFETEALVFSDGSVRETFLIPWGTERLIENLGRTLKLPRSAAEQLLTQVHGLEERPEWSQVPLRVKAGSLEKSFSQGQVIHGIAGKSREFLSRLQHQLQPCSYFRESAAGIVMVGSLTRLEGFLEAAESILNMPVRLGNLREIELQPDLKMNEFSTTAVGLLRYGQRERRLTSDRPWPATLWMRWVEKGRRVLEEYF